MPAVQAPLIRPPSLAATALAALCVALGGNVVLSLYVLGFAPEGALWAALGVSGYVLARTARRALWFARWRG